MRNRRGWLALVGAVTVVAGCTGGVDTGPSPTPTPTQTVTATPSPTGSGSPTPTPTNPGLSGDPWTTTADPIEDTCAFVFTVPYGTNGMAVIGIATTGSDLYFDIGLNQANPAVFAIGDAPSGTVDGAGNFTETYSYCIYNGNTYKLYATWTGTFAVDGLSFTNAALSQSVYFVGGDSLATCATGITMADAPCSPGSPLSYTIDGVKQ